MAGPVIDLDTRSPLWSRLPRVERIVEQAIAAAHEQGPGALLDGDEICVVLGDDTLVRQLNSRWRNKDASTNVLSFPQAFGGEGGGARFLGDIVLAFETVEREAIDEEKPLADHVAHLVVHGVLHLLGHDHVEDVEAARMEALETRILKSIGVADPYAAPAV